MKISVVVPTYNRKKLVARTLQTLFAQVCPASDYEIIVVVDGSTDGTAEALRRLSSPCTFRVVEQANRGLAGARNTGAREAQFEHVLFLDDDMQCPPDLVAAHLAAHRSGPPTVVFGALRPSPDSPRTLAAACFEREFAPRALEWKLETGPGWQDLFCIFSNTSLPRELLLEHGGFDESFRMREDLELSYRLLRAGVRAVSLPNAVAFHYYDKSTGELLRDARAFADADVRFARKHPENRIKGQLNWLVEQSRAKQQAQRLALAARWVADSLLVPACWLGQICIRITPFRVLGMRALLLRRRLRWLIAVRELTGSQGLQEIVFK